jgi:hypothetical protein
VYRIGKAPLLYYRCAGTGADRKGCGLMVPLDVTDAAVDEMVTAQLDMPVKVPTVVPGKDYAAELEQVQDDLAQVMLRALDTDPAELVTELSTLKARRDELAGKPAEPDHVEWIATGQTYAQEWEATPVPARGPWLAEHGFTVLPTREQVILRSSIPGWEDSVWRPGETLIDPMAVWQS